MKISFFFLIVLLYISAVTGINCPYYCRCLVSKHLRHVQCMGKGLISVDLNVPHTVQWLQLSNNSIYELEDNIFKTLGLRHIIELNLDNNAIQAVGLNAFSGLTKLRAIDLSDNRLHFIPPGIFQTIPSLIHVFLHGNPLRNLGRTESFLNSTSIQILDVSDCRISYISELAFSSLHALVKLNISSNHIENIDYFSFKDLIYLEDIDLSNNKINCDYKSEEFLTWTSSKLINIFGSVCKKATIPLPSVKTMEKIVMFDTGNVEHEIEDLSVNFDNECSCSTCGSKYEISTINSMTENRRSDKYDYLSLFLILSFIIGFVFGISSMVTFWIYFRVFKSKRRHQLCYKLIINHEPQLIHEELSYS